MIYLQHSNFRLKNTAKAIFFAVESHTNGFWHTRDSEETWVRILYLCSSLFLTLYKFIKIILSRNSNFVKFLVQEQRCLIILHCWKKKKLFYFMYKRNLEKHIYLNWKECWRSELNTNVWNIRLPPDKHSIICWGISTKAEQSVIPQSTKQTKEDTGIFCCTFVRVKNKESTYHVYGTKVRREPSLPVNHTALSF